MAAAGAYAQQRAVVSINSGWQFHKGDLQGFPAIRDASTQWEQVNLPHTWNTDDVADDSAGYYRGPGWYTKRVYVNSSWHNKAVYISFEGAGQVAEVYVNGRKAGTHIGGYTGFAFPIQQYLSFGDSAVTANDISVWVDNSHNEDIAPLGADFTFYGGIYRDVYLVATDSIHVNMDDRGGPGVVVSTPFVSASKASVVVKGAVTNPGYVPKNISVLTTIVDAAGTLIDRRLTAIQALPGNTSFTHTFETISSPHLWTLDNPYLYRVLTTVIEDGTRVIDQVNQPLGFRWFRFDANDGFYLNGEHTKLIGVNRHQDYKGLGNAVPDVLHVKDMELLKAMGCNFVRIAHYPQDPAVLEACDRLGILASVETPIVNRITESAAFAQNCKNMQTEMIRQNINHPSVIIWAYMNEVLLQPRYEAASAERAAYYDHVYQLAKDLDSLTRLEDSSRYTMIPCHGDFNTYHNVAHLTSVPQLVGWNLYQGWYGGEFADFGKFLDMHHRILPNKPVLVTEFGADADSRLHNFSPERFDKTAEYANRYHQNYLPAIQERDFVAGAFIWNLAEFNSEGRAEATPHINTKGLMTADRIPKDNYYYYQSQLVKYPYVAIGSQYWKNRAGVAVGDSALYCVQPLEIYTNQPEIIVKHNGVTLDTVAAENGVAKVDVPFVNGINEVEAIAPGHHDTTVHSVANINFTLVPADLKSTALPFTELHVSLGDKRYFTDELTGTTWLPERAYKAGAWGYTGGKVFSLGKGSAIPYGTNRNINGTTLDPLYQTQRTGLDYFRADVPDGVYTVTLHFCELLSNKEQETLAYNLGNDKGAKGKEVVPGRQFNVWVNDVQALQGLSNANMLQSLQPFTTTVRLEVYDGKGIVINFLPVKGESILNAVDIVKL
ncbi:beta-galactosidase [Deminuibacter soli]|uniref:Beta-galactosidase n=2 Tax=Deminuibacter soli TaxID=2291815 RepID=A0A3E1NK85_9BACT|nr:beta-galactosidase [Deminuibacter soli]